MNEPHFPWEAVAAMIALMVAVCAYLSWFVKVTVRGEFDKLDGVYLRSGESNVTGGEMERRIIDLERAMGWGGRRRSHQHE